MSHLVVDVEPEDDSPPFRARFTVSFLNDGDMVALTPGVGDRVPVRFRDTSHVELDLRAVKAAHRRRRQVERDALDAAAAAPVGSPPPESDRRGGPAGSP